MKRLIRPTIWVASTMLISYLLGVEFNWRIVTLCILSSLVNDFVYSDYTSVQKAWRRAAS